MKLSPQAKGILVDLLILLSWFVVAIIVPAYVTNFFEVMK